MVDVRFASAVQLMLSLALAEREGTGLLTSSELAASLATNPALTRRLVASLARAGLVQTTMGVKGGARLARPASAITLGDVYRAVLGENGLFAARADVPHRCVVSSNIETMFDALSRELEQAAIAALARRTLASELEGLSRVDAKRRSRASRAAS